MNRIGSESIAFFFTDTLTGEYSALLYNDILKTTLNAALNFKLNYYISIINEI
jgi:hypothetical protein